MISVLVIFLTSAALFGYLIIVTPIVSALLVSTPIYLIQAAPLFAMAISMLCLLFAKHKKTKNRESIYNFLTHLTTVVSFIGLNYLQKYIDFEINAKTKVSDILIEQATLSANLQGCYLLAMLIISLPFIFYGLFIYSVLSNSEVRSRHKLYAVEIFGIIFGSICASIALDYATLGIAIAYIYIFASLSVYFKPPWQIKHLCMIFAFIAAVALFNVQIFEPNRDLNLVARDFRHNYDIKNIKTSWSTYARVDTLDILDASHNSINKILALGAGTGQARIYNPLNLREPEYIVKALNPKEALVLFAGAGADMIAAKKLLPNLEVEGVEINKRILEHGRLIQKNLPHIHVSDARLFLRNSKKKYDLILYSWSGATLAHYSGAILHTTQFTFTTEGIAEALKLLNPDGYLVFFGASKVNLIYSLKKIGVDIAKSIALLQKNNESWLRGWDDHILIYKNGLWSSEELLALSKISESYKQVQWIEIEKLLANNNSQLYFAAHTDDRPFVYSTFLPLSFSELAKKNISGNIKTREGFVFYCAIICLFLLIILIAKLKNFSLTLLKGLCVMFSGVASTTLIQFSVYKFIFLIGNPTIAIIMSNALMIFTCLGALLVGRLSRWFTIGLVFLNSILVYTLFDFAQINGLNYIFLQLIIVGTSMFMTSYAFASQINSISEESHLIILLALNLLASAAASMFVPQVVENLGFSRAFQLGNVFVLLSIFALILLNLSLNKNFRIAKSTAEKAVS